MSKTFLFFLLFISIVSCSQEKSVDSNIKNDLQKYLEAIQNKKIDEAIDCIYPKFFELVSKEQQKQILESTYNNPKLEFFLKKFQIDSIKIPEKIGSESFTTVYYTFNINLKLGRDLIQKQSILQQGLAGKFGSENVRYEEKNQMFHILGTKKAIGVSQNDKTNWKFVVIEDEYKPFLINILPEKILNEN